MREAHIGAALSSVRELSVRLPDLTLAEVERALEIETAGPRRQTVIDRLLEAAVAKYRAQLKEKYTHG